MNDLHSLVCFRGIFSRKRIQHKFHVCNSFVVLFYLFFFIFNVYINVSDTIIPFQIICFYIPCARYFMISYLIRAWRHFSFGLWCTVYYVVVWFFSWCHHLATICDSVFFFFFFFFLLFVFCFCFSLTFLYYFSVCLRSEDWVIGTGTLLIILVPYYLLNSFCLVVYGNQCNLLVLNDSRTLFSIRIDRLITGYLDKHTLRKLQTFYLTAAKIYYSYKKK